MGKGKVRKFAAIAAVSALIILSGFFAAGLRFAPVSTVINASHNTAGQAITPAAAGIIGAPADYKVPLSLATPHVISDCTYGTVPYKTVNKSVSWLPPGQTVVSGGVDGEEQVCGASTGQPVATVIIPPTDKVITVGITAPLPAQQSADTAQNAPVGDLCPAAAHDDNAACTQPNDKAQ